MSAKVREDSPKIPQSAPHERSRRSTLLAMLIRLPERAESALSSLAIRERRDLRRQAEFLLLEVLRDRGLLEDAAGRRDESATPAASVAVAPANPQLVEV